jgi:hypothetical protein
MPLVVMQAWVKYPTQSQANLSPVRVLGFGLVLKPVENVSYFSTSQL